MDRYLQILLFIIYILSLSQCESTFEEIDHNSNTGIKLKDAYLNQRKLSIFPKNTKKFVVSLKPPTNIMFRHKPKQKIMPKLNLNQFTLKPTATLARKRPLMKTKYFTIKSWTNNKFDNIKKHFQDSDHTIKETKTKIGINTRMDVETEREDRVTEFFTPKENHIDVYSQSYAKDVKAEPNKISRDNISIEEEQGLKEFIFLETKDQPDMLDTLDNVGHEFTEDVETNTELDTTNKLERFKRSNNIIEEENMASTVSGLKFTGRDTRLNNNFNFKNINS